jgi:hypothetical protein
MDRDGGVVALVGEEGRDVSSGTRSIVVRKLHEGEELRPVVLLVIAIHPDILLQGLVDSLSLTVSFQMITGGEV